METVIITYTTHSTIMKSNDAYLKQEWHNITNQKREQYATELDHFEKTIKKLEEQCEIMHQEKIKLKKQPFTKFFTINYHKKQWFLDTDISNIVRKLTATRFELQRVESYIQIPRPQLERDAYTLMTKHGYHLHQKTETKDGLLEIWQKE